MLLSGFAFGTTEWDDVEVVESPGECGTVRQRVRTFGDVRVRLIEYSPGYLADHWCSKGHILFCVAGELQTELRDGRTFTLRAGTSYQAADGQEPHRSSTSLGATLFVVD